MKLEKNKGVCWAAVNQKKTFVVTDVHKFPGHIACDSRSNSEIAVPIFDKLGEVIGILDVDSREYSNFDASDAEYLEKLTNLIFMNIPLTKSSNYFLNEIENAVTVCDADGIILYMNNKSIETFANSGGEKLIGSNLYKCHPGNSKEKLQNIMTAQKTNSYYILKNGARKLIHQVPRFKSGIFDGFLEISIPIPDTIETFSRD